MARIAVIGVGAIGGYLAFRLAEVGHTVVLCARRPFARLRIIAGGIEQACDLAPVLDPVEVDQPVDWVLVVTKAHQSAAVTPWLERLVDDGTRGIVVVQNGVEHLERLGAGPGRDRVLPAMIVCACESPEPGLSLHHGGGSLWVPRGKLGADFAAVAVGPYLDVTLEDDFTTAIWRKLVINSVASPITTLTLRRLEVFSGPPARELARAVAEESITVAYATGAAAGSLDRNAILETIFGQDPRGGSSMLYDRLAGRGLEADALSGAVVRFGAKLGIQTPVNRALLTLLQLVDGRLPV